MLTLNPTDHPVGTRILYRGDAIWCLTIIEWQDPLVCITDTGDSRAHTDPTPRWIDELTRENVVRVLPPPETEDAMRERHRQIVDQFVRIIPNAPTPEPTLPRCATCRYFRVGQLVDSYPRCTNEKMRGRMTHGLQATQQPDVTFRPWDYKTFGCTDHQPREEARNG